MSMKIIHKYSIDSSPFRCARGVDGLIGGAFGLAGTLATNAVNEDIAESQLRAQREENQKNRDYNTTEAEKARQYGRDMLFAQQSYATQQWENQQRNALGLQLQGARENGVNPNVLLSGGSATASGGSVASPSAPSGPQAQFSSGLSPVPYQALNPAAAFAQVSQGLQSLATAKEKGVNVGLIEKQIENMSVDTQYKEVLKEGVILANSLSKLDLKYREKKLCQDIEEQVVRIGSLKSTIELQSATAKIQDSIRKLNESLANKHDQETELIKLDIASYDKKLQSYIKLQGAQIREANAKAFEAGESAKTIKEIRGWQVGFQQAQTEIAQAHSFVERNSAWEALQAKYSELEAMQMLPQQVKEAIEHARKENNWYEVEQITKIVDTSVRAVGTYYGARTGQGFVSAQNVRNRIEQDYKQWQMSKGIAPGRTYTPKEPWSPYGR